MQDQALAQHVLQEKNLTLCLVRDGAVLAQSLDKGIQPLYDLVKSGADYRGACAADRVVGRGAAMLFAKLGVRSLHSVVLSQPAKEALEAGGVVTACDELVPGIVNRAGDGPCPVEQLSWKAEDADDLMPLLKEFLTRIGGRP